MDMGIQPMKLESKTTKPKSTNIFPNKENRIKKKRETGSWREREREIGL